MVRFQTHEEPGSIEMGELIDHLGFGTFQYRLLLICGLGWMADATEGISVSFLFLALPDEFPHLTQMDLSILPMALALGMTIGGFVFGRFADLYGRKPAYITTVLITATAGVCQSMAVNYEMLVALKFISGLGLGGNLPVDFSMFSEFTPTDKRGKFLPILSTFWTLGELLGCGLAVTILTQFGWRMYTLSYALLGFFVLFLRRNIPESPSFLIATGQHQRAWNSLKQVAKVNRRELPEDSIVVVSDAEPIESRIGDLFSPGLWVTTIILWFSWCCSCMVYYGIFFFLPEYLQADEEAGEENIDQGSIFRDVGIACLGQIPGCLLTIFLMDNLGRRPTLVIGMMGTVVLMAEFGMLMQSKQRGWILIATVLLIKVFQAISYVSVYTYTTEVYPTHVRTTGIGSCSMVKQISVFFVPLIGSTLMETSKEASIYFFALIGAVGAFITTLLPIETLGMGLNDTSILVSPRRKAGGAHLPIKDT